MTAEAAAIADVGRERRVPLLRVVIDMARETAAPSIPSDIKGALCFCVAEVAARTLLAQHRIGHTVIQRLQVWAYLRAGIGVEHVARNLDHAVTGVHQVFADAGNTVGVTGAARALGIIEIARESDHALVCYLLERRRRVAGVTGSTVVGRKCMGHVESGLFTCMTFDAVIF